MADPAYEIHTIDRLVAVLRWFLTLVEWHRVIRWAVRMEAEKVHQETGLPLFYGAP